MSKTEKQTQKTSLDPRSQAFQQAIMSKAQSVADTPFEAYGGQMVAGADPMFMQGAQTLMGPGASGQYGQMANLGMGGAQAGMAGMQNFMGTTGLGGIQGFMNPYEQSVIEGARGDIGRAQQQAMSNVAGQAQRAGAFGGSRHALAEGIAASEIARTGQQDINALRQAGYTQAANQLMNQNFQRGQMGQAMAGQGANLGFGGLGGMEDIRRLQGQTGMAAGDYMRNIQQQGLGAQYGEFMREQDNPYRQLGAMQAGGAAALPYAGRTQTMEQKKSMLPQILGAATSIGSMFAPGGALRGVFGGGGGGVNTNPMGSIAIQDTWQRPTMPGIPQNMPYQQMPIQAGGGWMPQNYQYQQMPTAPWG